MLKTPKAREAGYMPALKHVYTAVKNLPTSNAETSPKTRVKQHKARTAWTSSLLHRRGDHVLREPELFRLGHQLVQLVVHVRHRLELLRRRHVAVQRRRRRRSFCRVRSGGGGRAVGGRRRSQPGVKPRKRRQRRRRIPGAHEQIAGALLTRQGGVHRGALLTRQGGVHRGAPGRRRQQSEQISEIAVLEVGPLQVLVLASRGQHKVGSFLLHDELAPVFASAQKDGDGEDFERCSACECGDRLSLVPPLKTSKSSIFYWVCWRFYRLLKYVLVVP